jgi:diguanylate cyclase (GGDEF)-like protein/PAS domain S-box-containing protein
MLLRSIRSQVLGLVFATVIPFAGLIGVGLWSQWQSDHAAAFRRALADARLLASQVDDHIGNLENLLVGLGGALSTDPADIAANDRVLRKAKSELPEFISNIQVFDLEGRNIGTSSDYSGRLSAAHRSYFRDTLERKTTSVGEVNRGRPHNQWVVSMARPIADENGRLRAVIAVGTRLDHFQQALRLSDLPEGSVVRIINEKAIVVAQSGQGPNWIGRDLSAFEHVTRHMLAKDASESVAWSDGIERITGSATAFKVPWLVSVGLPADVAFAPIVSRFWWGLGVSTATIVIAFAIAWMLSGRIMRPLRQLRRDASMLAAGRLEHRTEVDSQDELGALARAFNRMAASLQQRQQEGAQAADEVRHAKETLSAVIEASPVAVIGSDMNRRIFMWNRAAEQVFGYTAAEVMGHPTRIISPHSNEKRKLFERALGGETIRDMYLKRRRKDGTLVDVRMAAARMYHPDGSLRGVARVYEDVSDRRRAEEQLNRLAHYDLLTGLPNRHSLQKQLGRLLAGPARERPTAIALFDLDRFKDVNDTLGHSTGDELLIEVAGRFTDTNKTLGYSGNVYRLGGDEFVVVMPDCGDPGRIAEVVQTILRRLAQPFEINDHVLHVAGSGGVAIAPGDGTTPDELISNADDGGGIYRLYVPVLRARAQARRALDHDLRRAFAENEFEIHYQPQIRMSDDAVMGAEALLRWRHPERGLVAPGAFIDTLAQSPIAPEVGRWIIRAACRQVAAWRGVGLPLNRVSINLFPSQLQESLCADIETILGETALPADVLELEITENFALDYEPSIGPLQKLDEMGVTLAFDDFGTGYASLSYLTRFPLSRIKIDRSFIAKITDDAEDAAIVRSLIAMAHNLGLRVTAEGVETNAQRIFLLKEQCEEAQGFLFARPLPALNFEAYLRTSKLGDDAEAPAGAKPYRPHGLRQRRAAGKRRRMRAI